MEDKSKGQKKSNILAILVQLVIGGCFGLFGMMFITSKFNHDNWTPVTLILFLLFAMAAFFININIHEFGHFVFGKLSGYRLISYRAGIFSWSNENGRMKLSIIKNKGYSGLCAMVPPEHAIPMSKEILYYSGGILFNIVSGLAFILISYLAFETSEIAQLFFLTLGGIALFLGITNFLPFVSQNYFTDGKIIWGILFKETFTKKMTELKEMTAQMSAGVRPRNLQIAYALDRDNLQALDMGAVLFSYFKALDSSNLEEMNSYAALLEKNIGIFPHHALPSLYYELCYMACISDDQSKAKTYYEKAGKILQNDKDVNGLRVKAYYEYYINNDINAARVFCDSAMAVADKFPIKGQGLMEQDLVKALQHTIHI